MSEDFDFNPKKKEDDKGVGKIRLEKDGTPGAPKVEEDKKKATATRKKWLLGGGAAVLGVGLVLGLAGVFNGSSNPGPVTQPPTPVVQVEPGTVTPPPVVQTSSAAQLLQQSIRAKENSIYRNSATAYYETNSRGNRTGGTGEAYIDMSGQEVQRGRDFAAHVQLFDKGQVSILVAAGPYAGSRIEFTPVRNGGATVTYNRVGQEARGSDGQTVVYQALPSAQQTTQSVSMRSPAAAGSGVSVPVNAFEYTKMVQEEGQQVEIYTIRGDVEQGIFSVKIFNGDVYDVNFSNGQYSVNSVFLHFPNWQETVARGGEIDARGIQTINGRLNVAPAVRPGPAVTQQSAPAPVPGG